VTLHRARVQRGVRRAPVDLRRDRRAMWRPPRGRRRRPRPSRDGWLGRNDEVVACGSLAQIGGEVVVEHRILGAPCQEHRCLDGRQTLRDVRDRSLRRVPGSQGMSATKSAIARSGGSGAVRGTSASRSVRDASPGQPGCPPRTPVFPGRPRRGTAATPARRITPGAERPSGTAMPVLQRIIPAIWSRVLDGPPHRDRPAPVVRCQHERRPSGKPSDTIRSSRSPTRST
jgi:hypothetical protein